MSVLAELIGPRHSSRPTSVEAATAYLRRQLGSAWPPAHDETFHTTDGASLNIYIEKPGQKKPNQLLVVGAHYDTVAQSPGADDNASALAALIEAGFMLQESRFDRTVRLIAFANEEDPHYHTRSMGSQHHARRCRHGQKTLVGMIALEMLGYYHDEPGSQRYPEQMPRWLASSLPRTGRFLAMVSNARSAPLLCKAALAFRQSTWLPLIALPLPQRIRDIRRSDHGPFWDQQLPALMLTDTGNLRNPNYHQPTDTPDTLDYDRLAQATLGITHIIRKLGREKRRG